MVEYKNIEWLAYLLGTKDGEPEIKDIFVPIQNISVARVDNIKCNEYNNIPVIGVIHSHHSMGSNFSGTDNEWINQNHDISLCISHTELKGHFRYKTECGACKIIPVSVKLKIELDFDDKKFIESVKENLKKPEITNFGYGIGYGYNGYNYNTSVYNRKEDEKDDLNSLLTETEKEELEKEIDELDFEKELSLAEEMELLNEMNNSDSIE